jgi:hypothetical protein
MFSIFQNSGRLSGKLTSREILETQIVEIGPAPRRVKASWMLFLQAAIFLLILLIFSWEAYSRIAAHSETKLIAVVFPIMFLLLLAIFSGEFLREWRNNNLLRNGIFVTGRVIAQRRVKQGRGSKSEIVYQFPVGPGKPMTGRGYDATKLYAMGSYVLVCFCPKNISQNVAICSTGWRVYDRSGFVLEP